ncbi:MAG: MFS transporter [Chloroflexi bacterium]|nr:MFS transporter [Chloroflexota bacterium]
MRFSPFLLLCATGLFGIFSTTISKNPALPLFASALGATEGNIGFIAAASTVVGIVSSVPAGVLSDIYGRRRVILVAGFIFASAPFLYLLVHSPWQLVLVRVYHGFATAIFGPVAMALVADLFSASRGEKMGWYSSATLIGRFIAPLAGGFILSYTNNTYQWVYIVCGVGGVLALAAAFALPKDRSRAGAGQPGLLAHRWRETLDGLRQIVGNVPILATSTMEALQYFSYGALETFLPLYAVFVIKLSPWEVGVIFGAQLLTTTLMKPIMGRTSDRMGRQPMIVAGLVTSGVGMALVPFAQSFVLLVPVGIVFGLGLAVVTASTSAYVSEMAKASHHGSALGVLSSIMDIGHASGPIAMGLLVANLGYMPGFVAVAALLALGSASFAAVMARPAAVPARG